MPQVKLSSKTKYILAGLMALAVLAFILFSFLGHPKLYTIMPQETLQSSEEGEGLFVYYEYAPILFSGEDMSGLDLDTNRRYAAMTALGKLSDDLKVKGKAILSHSEAIKNQENLSLSPKLTQSMNRMMFLSQGLNTAEDGADYRTDFTTVPREGNHKYPQLGDDRPVPDLVENGRDWEEAYISACLSSGQVMSGPYGRILLSTDGLEEGVTPAILSGLGPRDIRGKKPGLEQKQDGLTFVEDRVFYLAVDLGRSVGERDFEVGDRVPLKVDGLFDLEGQLDRKVESKEGDVLYIFSLQNGYSKIAGKRYCSVSLLERQQDVFFLPFETVATDESGKSYCYRLDRTNSAEKVHVKIVEKKDEGFYVSAEAPEDPKAPRLSAYDQILYNPKEIQEGKNY